MISLHRRWRICPVRAAIIASEDLRVLFVGPRRDGGMFPPLAREFGVLAHHETPQQKSCNGERQHQQDQAPELHDEPEHQQDAEYAHRSSAFSSRLGHVERAGLHELVQDAGDEQPVNNIFAGIDVDLAVRGTDAWIYRLGYNITLLGRVGSRRLRRFPRRILVL